MTDPTLARLDALGHENRALRAKVDTLTETLADLRVDLAHFRGTTEQACGAIRDLKRESAQRDARVHILEEAKARAAGMRIALSMFAGAGSAAGYSWASDHGGLLRALSTLWAV